MLTFPQTREELEDLQENTWDNHLGKDLLHIKLKRQMFGILQA